LKRVLALALLPAALLPATLACPAAPPSAPPPLSAPEAPENRALFAPAAGLLPMPNDLLLDDERRSALGVDASLSAAQRELIVLLQTTGGFPITSEITVPLSTPVTLAAATDALVFLDLTTGEQVASDARFVESTLELKLRAATPLAGGHTYVVALRKLVDVDGDTLEPDLQMRALLSRDPLISDDVLEAERQLMQPLLQTLSDAGASREELLTVFAFTTTDRPAVWFDEASDRVPFPGAHAIDPVTGLIRIPPFPVEIQDDPTVNLMREELATYDGFSTTAALVYDTTSPIERDSAITAGAVRLFKRTDAGWEEHDDLERGVRVSGDRGWVRPRLALDHSSTYAWVVTDGVRAAAGGGFVPQGPAALLQLRAPLVVDGASALLGVTHADAARFEDMRKDLADLSARFEGTLASLALFQTTAAPSWVMEHTDQLVLRDTPTTLSDLVDESPWDRGVWVTMPEVTTVISGSFSSLDFIDPTTQRMRMNGPEPSTVPFVLTIPEGVTPEEPLPVVIFGHGLITSRELAYLLANRLAKEGIAVIAIDFPLHGLRSICKDDTSCSGDAVCGVDGRCLLPDGSPGELRSIASPWSSGPDVPITTGQGFIDPIDVFATRDHFLQGIVDLKQTVRVLQSVDWSSEIGWNLDGTDIGYTGISLGGIFGAMLSGVEADVHSFGLNVPGADLIRLMKDSEMLGVMLQRTLDEHGLTRDSDAYFAFEQAARWAVDPVDPMNLAHHATWSVLFYEDAETDTRAIMPAKRMIIQMADGDAVVPNSGTHQLSDRTGVEIDVYTPLISGHGFLADPTSLEGGRARDQLADFLSQ